MSSTDDRIHLTMSSVSTGELDPTGFARKLRHNATDVRYYDPPKPSPRGRRSMPASAAPPYTQRGCELAREHAERYTRWTAEREQAMPTQRGKLTRRSVSYAVPVERQVRGATCVSQVWYVDVSCECGHCMRVERSTWVSDTRGPRQCVHCAREARRGRAA